MAVVMTRTLMLMRSEAWVGKDRTGRLGWEA